MSQVGNQILCDGCDRDLGNGSLVYCIAISTIDPETGTVDVLHLCLGYEAGGKTVQGCGSKILTKNHIAAYLKRRTAAREAEAKAKEAPSE